MYSEQQKKCICQLGRVLTCFKSLGVFFQVSLFLFHFVLLSVSHPKTWIGSCIALELSHSRSFVSSVGEQNHQSII